MALVKRDAAILVTDADAMRDLAGAVLGLLADQTRRETLAANAAAMGRPEATETIVNIIEGTVQQSHTL